MEDGVILRPSGADATLNADRTSVLDLEILDLDTLDESTDAWLSSEHGSSTAAGPDQVSE